MSLSSNASSSMIMLECRCKKVGDACKYYVDGVVGNFPATITVDREIANKVPSEYDARVGHEQLHILNWPPLTAMWLLQ